ncbi:EAL domain-containing protein [Phreatobacter sp.]|uniref:sensor domain-containing protein n=1 Tax=Phreatobacter sp. TaxID=1966341 RepID=UPI0025E25CAF|nr:EAL domain-containing protein [Phreatobacter sp.]
MLSAQVQSDPSFRRIVMLSNEIVSTASKLNDLIATKYQPAREAAEHSFQNMTSGLIVVLLVGYVSLIMIPLWRRMHEEAARFKAMSAEVWKLSTVAHRTTNIVILTDVEGRIEWTNSSFERISGYSLTEVRGRKPGSFLQFEETDQSTVDRIREAVRAKRPVQAELLNRSKAGQAYWLNLDIQPLHSEGGEHIGFMAIESDITELKRVTTDLLRKNFDLAVMSELACIGEWVLDLQKNSVYWSRQVRRIHEVDEGYIPTFEAAVAFYPVHVRQRLTSGLESCIATKGSWECELPFLTAKGNDRWVRVYATAIEEKGSVTKLIGAFQDITDIVRSRSDLEISSRRLEMAAEGASIGLWEWDVASKRLWVHPKWWTHLGFDEPGGASPITIDDLIIHPDDLRSVVDNRTRFLQNGAAQLTNEFRQRDVNGVWRWVSSTGRATAFDKQGRPLRVSGVYVDIHERKLAAERAQFAASHDHLTGLMNRAEFVRQIDARIARRQNADDTFAVLAIDLDRFKYVNDSFGHAAGDAVLAGVASRLRAILREADILARLGGDEFAIIVDGRENCRERCAAVAARILNEIRRDYVHEGKNLQIGASVGIAVADENTVDHETLMRAADTALYAVKESGKNSYRFFDQELAFRAQERRDIEADLRFAQDRGEFELHFQPQVDLVSRQYTSFEALIRWRHPHRGLVSPDLFIPIAEETGLIVSIGQWVIEEACRIAAHWPEPLPVSINLSAAQLGRSDLLAIVTQALLQTNLHAHRLEIEMTESVFMNKDDTLLRDILQLHDLGVRLALDDFGTGYSSLGYLHKLPFDKIKIDKSFIADIATSAQSAAIICAIVNLARSLGIETTAEGIETEEQASLVLAAGCAIGQGFLFSPPVPEGEVFTDDRLTTANGALPNRTRRRADSNRVGGLS